MIGQFEYLRPVTMSYEDLERIIVERGLTDYAANAIREISESLNTHVEERTFDGYALEAIVGMQLEAAKFKVHHNTELAEHWYDIALDNNKFVDVKKHTSWPHQTKWLTIHKSVLERRGQLRHLRDYGNLKRLYILFMNVTYEGTDPVMCKIDPSWVVRADTFFDQLVDSEKNPDKKYFQHNNAIQGVDYIRFNF